jgi:tryptophan-rich sensory protein
MQGKKIIQLVFWILLCQLAGVAGALFTETGADSWYAGLVKPEFNPPNWLFAPVWTTLYTLMGLSVYFVQQESPRNSSVRSTVRLFVVHLFFNATFSLCFFYLESTLLGLINIIIILGFVVVLLTRFWKIRRLSAYLLIPYLAWLLFAAVLNFSLLVLNW